MQSTFSVISRFAAGDMENCQPKSETQHTQFNYGRCYTNDLRGSGNARFQVELKK